MASFPLQYGQAVFVSMAPGEWVGGLASPIGGDCSTCKSSIGGNNQTNGIITNVQTQLPDEFVILDSNGNNPGGTVNYKDQVTFFNKTQNSFWLVDSGCMYMSPSGGANLVVLLASVTYVTGAIMAPLFPSPSVSQYNSLVAMIPGGKVFVNSMANGAGEQAVALCTQQNSFLSLALVEAPPPPSPSPVPLVPIPPTPEIISIQSSYTGTYLTVCDECNQIPGFSVDVHASGPSQQAGSLWQMINSGPNLVGLLNTLTGTYLTVYQGSSVNVQATSISQLNGSEWRVTTQGFLNTLTNTFLSVVGTSKGYTVSVSGSSQTSSSTWNIESLSPLPSPIPFSGGSGTNGTKTSDNKWIFWLGVGLWLMGMILTLGIPAGYLPLRLVSLICSLAGIGLMFYLSF